LFKELMAIYTNVSHGLSLHGVMVAVGHMHRELVQIGNQHGQSVKKYLAQLLNTGLISPVFFIENK